MENKNNSGEHGIACYGSCHGVKKTAIVLGAVLIAFLAIKIIGEVKSIGYIGKSATAVNVITVSGKGEVLATPDTATFSFSVSKEAQTVADAQKQSADKVNAVLAYLSQNGIEDKDVKTTSYNIYPRYEYSNTTGKQTLAAYVVSQSVEVKVKKLEDAGRLLGGIGMYGATDISSLSFSNDKQDDLALEARDKAIKDARAQAQVLARSLGVKIGDITSFYESSSGGSQPIYYAKAMNFDQALSSAVPSLPSGENKITSNVTITYEIK